MKKSNDHNLNIKNRKVLIIGGLGGIGFETAKRFDELGADVCIGDRNIKSFDHPSIKIKKCDISDKHQCEEIIHEFINEYGRLDVLINAAALLIREDTNNVTEEAIESMTKINMNGSFYLARAAANFMKKQESGRIILFSSQGGHTGGYIGSTIYSMTKSAVISLCKSLAREYAPHGITVNAIAPGIVNTQLIKSNVSHESHKKFMDMVPMGRIADPVEIANCCLFLASDWASFITGHTLDVNGGQVMR